MSHDTTLRLIRVFLSSPGDVEDERAIARRAIKELADDPLIRNRAVLRIVAWDELSSRTPMLATLTPQEAINRRLPKPSDCDIVVVVLWSRMGTPLPYPEYQKPSGEPYYSGTEWEYLDAERGAREHPDGRPLIVLYRRTEKVLVDIDDPEFEAKKEQHERVKTFFECFSDPSGSIVGGYNSYASPDEFRALFEVDLRELVDMILSQPADRTATTAPVTDEEHEPAWPPDKSPFPGLRAFGPDDAPIFFGRGRETDALLKRLGESRFLAVVGASGSGKSSLVGAGLIPRLKDNAITGSKDWCWIRFTPGEVSDDPFTALGVQLAPLTGRTPRGLADDLRADPARIADIAVQALAGRPDWAELLLFVDQFEELFTVVHPDWRAPFVDLLDAAARADRLRIIATLRADFYHACLKYKAVEELLRAGSFPLGIPNQIALYEMITRPAARASLEFENGLPECILDDTGDEPGSLALMAYTLDELYQDCCDSADGQLSHAAYNELGGVQGAIGTRAENTFAGLETEAKATLPRVFRELVEVDERGTATRQRAPLARFEGSEAAWRLLEAFTEARLLTASRVGDEAVIEVAHEALFRSWPRLAEWIETAQDDLRLLRQVTLAAHEWHERDRDPVYRWPHERLKLVYAMQERLQPTLDTITLDFIQPEFDRMMAEINDPATHHFRRAAIGDRLNEIRDTRPGVGVHSDGLPDVVWCDVPAGEIELEDNAGTFEVQPFQIAKYPVTYVQYWAFLEAPDGYCEPQWWDGLHERQDKPGQQRRPNDNHPAENVSWYDAVAFCRWLSQRLGENIRLPTEWEWQQAATGGNPRNSYPWGLEWDDGKRCNTYESGLSRTTAVGMYPQGASPVGVLDMSGNVYERCLNEYEDAQNTGLAGNARRVVRGGSWAGDRDGARCAYRLRFNPRNRSGTVGFRLVRVPHL
jgi:formylglycine-generating enzyme required for sulfatase activity